MTYYGHFHKFFQKVKHLSLGEKLPHPFPSLVNKINSKHLRKFRNKKKYINLAEINFAR